MAWKCSRPFFSHAARQREHELVWGAPDGPDVLPLTTEVGLGIGARVEADHDLLCREQPQPALRLDEHGIGQPPAGDGPCFPQDVAEPGRLLKLAALLLGGRFEDGEVADGPRLREVAFERLARRSEVAFQLLHRGGRLHQHNATPGPPDRQDRSEHEKAGYRRRDGYGGGHRKYRRLRRRGTVLR